MPGTPSTHIIKPNSLSPDYPALVINEFFIMRLADAVGVTVPAVDRLFAPAPAYPIERFDRVRAPGDSSTQRIHIIDTCQLLNKSRTFKYRQANLASLGEAIKLCRAKTTARVQLYRWLLFNGLASLLLAPPVDLKIAYETRSRPDWMRTSMDLWRKTIDFEIPVHDNFKIHFMEQKSTILRNFVKTAESWTKVLGSCSAQGPDLVTLIALKSDVETFKKWAEDGQEKLCSLASSEWQEKHLEIKVCR